MPSETSLVRACLIFLTCQGAMAWRSNTGAMRIRGIGQRDRFVRFGPVGQPDILGIGPPPDGRAICVECKRGANPLTKHQARFLEQARSHGAFAVYVRSVQELEWAWEEAKRLPQATTSKVQA